MEYYYQPNSDKEMCEKADRLAYEALNEVTIKYGSGYADGVIPEVQDLAYHNLQHSWRVKGVAERLAKKLGMNEYDIVLTGLIAASHDVVHESVDGKSAEQASIEWLINKMQIEGFSDEDQYVARLAIESTVPLKDTDGNFMGQQFPLIGFPDERAGTIALCIVAADMEAAYAHYGPIVHHELYKEKKGIPATNNPDTLDGLIQFQIDEIRFLETLQPLFMGMDHMFGGLKQQAIEHHTYLLEELRTGRIMTWVQVQQYDNDFALRFKDNGN